VVRAGTSAAGNSPVALTGFIASATSSKASTAGNHPPVSIRFWAYGADSVIGDVRYTEGGYSGRYAWAPVAIGKDCAVPYVRFIFGGIPAGRYAVSVRTPDVTGLARQVEVGNEVIDETAHPGQWLSLGTQQVVKDGDGGTSFELMMSQPAASLGDENGCRAGTEHVAFDAVWIGPV